MSPRNPADLAADHPLAGCKALWHPEAPRVGPVWCLFRRELVVEAIVPESQLWFSGSQRCRIWLDGKLLAEGPPRSDRETWPYMTVNLPELVPGKHLLAIEVVHYGKSAGKGQIGGPGFLLVATESKALEEWRSDNHGWRCRVDNSRSVLMDKAEPGHPRLKGHRAIGPGQIVDFSKYPNSWRCSEFDDTDWADPVLLSEPHNNPWGNRSLGCHLMASMIPQMRRHPHDWVRLLRDSGEPFELPLVIEQQSSVRLIADVGCLITAYPDLAWRDGEGASIRVTSCEAPYDPETGERRERDGIKGAFLPGQADQLLCSGPGSWSPEWIRSFRYLVLDIETGPKALILESLSVIRSGFPLYQSLVVSIEDNRPWKRLLEVNRNTMAACSHETFFDAPSWEQAQFPGDARIMARHHYLSCNDDRLPLKAIADCAASRTPSGLLRSHWPSSFEQVISTYSLQWIGMLHDYWWYRGETAELKPHLPVARGILEWFLDRQRPDGLVGRIDEAPFVDWAFRAGCPEQASDGGSSILTALLAESCMMVAALESVGGYAELSPRWKDAAVSLRAGLDHCWDAERQLLRDHPEGGFSLHAQVQAVLAGYWEPLKGGVVLERALSDPDCLQPATLYYRAHLAEALRRADRADLVLPLFDVWFDMLEAGVTTWPETDSPQTRSDCHGWGCMVETEIVHSLFGLTPDEPGWGKIRFNPHPSINLRGTLSLQLPAGELRATIGADPDQNQITVPDGTAVV